VQKETKRRDERKEDQGAIVAADPLPDTVGGAEAVEVVCRWCECGKTFAAEGDPDEASNQAGIGGWRDE